MQNVTFSLHWHKDVYLPPQLAADSTKWCTKWFRRSDQIKSLGCQNF